MSQRFASGWIRQYRDDVFYQLGNRRYELLGFWTYLLAIASRYEISIQHKGIFTRFPAGTIITSTSELANSNKSADRKWIKRMLNTLQQRGLIRLTQSSQGQVISIVDWDQKYGDSCEIEVIESTTNAVEKEPKKCPQNVSPVIPKCPTSDLNPPVQGIEIYDGIVAPISDPYSLCPVTVTTATPNLPLNGEREREEEKKEELKGDQSLSAPITQLRFSGEISERRLSLVTTAPPDERKSGQQGEAISQALVQANALPANSVPAKKGGKPPVECPRFIAAYVKAYQKRYGEKCRPYLSGKIRGQIQQFLRDVPIDRACELIQVYCQMDDKWFLTKEHDFSTFINNQNKISNALALGKEGFSGVDWGKVFTMGAS